MGGRSAASAAKDNDGCSPSDVVRLSDKPDCPGMRVCDGGREDVAGLDRGEGHGVHGGSREREDVREGEFHGREDGWVDCRVVEAEAATNEEEASAVRLL